jgi:hypothetical protein
MLFSKRSEDLRMLFSMRSEDHRMSFSKRSDYPRTTECYFVRDLRI